MSKLSNLKWALGAALAGLVLAAPAGAATIGFELAPIMGSNFSVDVVVSDLGGEVVSAYDLDITFDDTTVTVGSVAFGSALGSGLFDAQLTSPGVLDVAGLSLLSDAELLALQGGDTVTLFTIGGTLAPAAPPPEFGFVFDEFNDVKGLDNQILELDAGGEVIPEPSAALVFAVGALLVGAATRRRA
jgi:hypothetical protein